MSSPRPLVLRLEGGDLVIEWNDGVTARYPPDRLRQLCPCATCKERIARAAPTEAPRVTLKEVKPVGNYAYKIGFSDGHDTGIYTLDYLYEIGQRS
ncbi:DUF971 domain-containing protein [Thermogutta sp.]|jgi:DUF971 family protein|uniref:DUF971 domain-containing protein n=1 Tax=Thermogutta sp. TaxID=1962930 RepID=UPI00321FDEDA